MSVQPIKALLEEQTWLNETQRTTLEVLLVDRENKMADQFRMAGMQFGMFPQIIAEVFAEVGIGSPIDETERTFIRAQFIALMEELQRQQGGI
jgi:hypothetical protein